MVISQQLFTVLSLLASFNFVLAFEAWNMGFHISVFFLLLLLYCMSFGFFIFYFYLFMR